MRALRLLAKLLQRVHLEWRLLLWRVLGRFRRTVTVHTQQGVLTVRLGSAETIGQELFCRGQYELDFVDEVLALLERLGRRPPKGAGTMLDVGANVGVISIGLLHRGEFARAVAVEPEPANFTLLQQNVARNHLASRMACLQCAVSDQSRKVQLELSGGNFGDHRVRVSESAPEGRFGETGRAEITVAARTLDELVAELPGDYRKDLALLWIDVQGHEGQVFRGAPGLLRTGIPVVAEIWPYGLLRAGTSAAAFTALASAHWRSYWAWRRNRFVEYPIAALELLFNELGEDGDYENVVFTP